MLPADEVMEHMEFAIPHSWQKQMILQGFSTVERTMDEFLEFCKRLETAKDIFDHTHKKSQKGKPRPVIPKILTLKWVLVGNLRVANENRLPTYTTVCTMGVILPITWISAR